MTAKQRLYKLQNPKSLLIAFKTDNPVWIEKSDIGLSGGVVCVVRDSKTNEKGCVGKYRLTPLDEHICSDLSDLL